jgi:hypothetical protein
METSMVPRSFLRNLTNEERLILRRWKYFVAAVYGVIALTLVGLSVLITSGQATLETIHAGKALDR